MLYLPRISSDPATSGTDRAPNGSPSMTDELPDGGSDELPDAGSDDPQMPEPAGPPGDEAVPADGTLGGYLEVHTRPPAFDGSDGQPYSVSIEVERVASLTAPYAGYLVFPRWAETGVGIVGHVETPVLWEARSPEEITAAAGALSLAEVKRLLDEAIRVKGESD
jgi:hypothetical protein